MTYKDTIHYLYSRLPFFSHTGKAAYKTDITNTVLLCSFINDPQKKIKTIHVAGTNGKGSTSHMLASIFQQSGFKTGLYTSPHLKDFRERIKVNGEMISEEFIIAFVKKIKNISEEISPSFFEVTVAMAFDFFAFEKVDIAIIETGLGGRLDSTNIIMPEISIITNIGYDHMNILGNSLQEIAFEKAGIIKKNTPVIIGESIPETRQIFLNKAFECKSPIIFAEEEYIIDEVDLKDSYLEIILKSIKGNKEVYRSDLNGLYQQKNIRTVITASKELLALGYDLKKENIVSGLLKVKELTGLHGRWEIIHHHPLVVLDVAHNEDGIRLVTDQIKMYPFKQLHIVFGIVKDKDADKILALLPGNAIYYFTNAKIPRALPAEELILKAGKHGLKGNTYAEVNEALREALNNADTNDMVIICGSVFIIAEVNLELLTGIK